MVLGAHDSSMQVLFKGRKQSSGRKGGQKKQGVLGPTREDGWTAHLSSSTMDRPPASHGALLSHFLPPSQKEVVVYTVFVC